MSADCNSFDRLVAGLSSDERGLLLKKLKANIEPEKESLEFEVPEDSSSIVDLKRIKQRAAAAAFVDFFKEFVC